MLHNILLYFVPKVYLPTYLSIDLMPCVAFTRFCNPTPQAMYCRLDIDCVV